MTEWNYPRERAEASLARQLEREHREGMAEERLERERRAFTWDVEGWTDDNELQLYIAGSGLHRIPADEVVRLANAMLAEHHLHFETSTPEGGLTAALSSTLGYDFRCRERGVRGTRCMFSLGHARNCRFGPGYDPAYWRTDADGSLVCPHRDLSVCSDCATLPGVTEVAGAHFYDPDGKIAEATDG